MSTILTKTFNSPRINRGEILRYARCNNPSVVENELLDECILEVTPVLNYKVCYTILECENSDVTTIGGVSFNSKDLKKCLDGCKKTAIFVATIGMGIDRLIKKYSTVSPTKALFMQAIGAERVESLCDEFCKFLSLTYNTTPRFSPGYGDLSLQYQKDVFDILEPTRHVGVYLLDTLLMVPSKSVSAIVGIKGE